MTEKPEGPVTGSSKRNVLTPAAVLAGDLDKDRIAALRMQERLRGLSDHEVVRRWLVATDQWELNDKQDWIRKRLEYAKAQFLKRKKFTVVRDALIREFGISERTASRDMKEALDVFGDIDRVPKEAHRQRAIQMALEAFKVAKKNKDADGMTKAGRLYHTAAGLDNDDPDRIDMEKLMQDRVYAEILDPAIRELLLNFMEQAGGSVDVSKLFETIYAAKGGEYVAYERLPDDAGPDPAGD